MQNILFICKEINYNILSIANQLRELNHSVTLLTYQNQKEKIDQIKIKNKVEILFYYQSGKWQENIKLLPRLLMNPTQIIHLFIDHSLSYRNEIVLAFILKKISHSQIVTSFMNSKLNLKKSDWKNLIYASRLITTSSELQIHQFRGLEAPELQSKIVLSPLIDLEIDRLSLEKFPCLNIFLNNKKSIFLPFQEKNFRIDSRIYKLIQTLLPTFNIFLWGSTKNWTSNDRKQLSTYINHQTIETKSVGQIYVTGEINKLEISAFLSKCEWAFIAFSDFEDQSLLEIIWQILATPCQLVLDDQQSMIHPQTWRHKKNCYLLNYRNKKDSTLSWLDEIQQKEFKTIVADPQEIKKSWVDDSINQLIRAYSQM